MWHVKSWSVVLNRRVDETKTKMTADGREQDGKKDHRFMIGVRG